jgi:hypothetical protein
MSMRVPLDDHPLVRALSAVDSALDDVAGSDPTYLPTADKARVLMALDRELSRLEGLRLELLAAAGDLAVDRGARSAGVWLASETRAGIPAGARDQKLAESLSRWPGVVVALRAGQVNPTQAAVISRALDALPADLDAELATKAEAQLVAEAGHFPPRELRVLGRRVLDVVAPAVGEAEEERLLLAEEDRGRAETRVSFRPRGDGVTDVLARLPDHVADRLRIYLDAFTSPRRRSFTDEADAESSGRPFDGDVERMPLPRQRGEAFCALMEHLPSDGLPRHGGAPTSVMVMVDFETLQREVGVAETSAGGHLTAGEVRRLACGAGILPVVLGGAGEVLDLGRSRRLFSPAQRKALAIRDRRCRAEGCEIPAAWCEAHHAGLPWSQGGRTDVADGVLLCSFHHHRAHHPKHRADRLPSGDVRFTRRT